MFSLVALFWVVVTGSVATAQSTVLTWRDVDKKDAEAGKWPLGQGLLERETFPDETAAIKPEEATGEIEKPDTEELPMLADDVLAAYFEKKPASLLVDPQHLLSQAVYRDQLAYLTGHVADATTDLVVYVFDGKFDLPGAARAEEAIERFYASGRPTALVFYFTQAPRRTRLFVSPALGDRINALEQQRMLSSAVAQAMGKSGAAEQLEALTRQLSIRLYLLDDAPKLAALAAGAKKPSPKEAKVSSLDKLMAKLPPGLQESLSAWLLPAGVICSALAVMAVASWLLRMRSRYRFPNPAGDTRLGGDYAAGIGAVIGFSPAAGSPNDQRPESPVKF